MINIKASKPDAMPADPADPLNLRPQPEPATRILSSWMVGLISVGLYIKSFLWNDGTQPVGGNESRDDDSISNSVPLTEPIPTTQRDTPQSVMTSGNDAAAGARDLNPRNLVIEGQFQSGIFAAAPMAGGVGILEAFSTNTIMPLFIEPSAHRASPSGLWADGFAGVGISSDGDRLTFGNEAPPVPSSPPVDAPENIIRPDFGAPSTPTEPNRPLPSSPDSPTEPAVPAPAAEVVDPGGAGSTPTEESPIEHGGTGNPSGPAAPQRNRAPRNSGPVMLGDIGSGAVLAFTLDHFLSRTNDADGDQLQISFQAPTSGALIQKGNGWRYFADNDDLGEVRISYTISDGTLKIDQTAILNVVENQISGTEGDDLLVGTRGRDAITAMGGDDLIAGLAGSDRIFGGPGDDNIAGGAGDDLIYGGAGDDIIVGGHGNDLTFGGAGDDQLYGGTGDDLIHGDAGDDLIHGDAGGDQLYGGTGDDLIHGDAGDDLIHGDAGDDQLYGGTGDDLIHGDAGDDAVFGGAGADRILGGAGNDILSGGDGRDVMSGDADNDHLNGDGGEDVIYGGTGQDVIHGGGASDVIFGGDESDVIAGDAGNDILSGDGGDDIVMGGAGDDILLGGDGTDAVYGGDGDDVILGDDDWADDHYDGGNDTDVLSYADASQGVDVDLVEGQVTGLSIGTDMISNFETVIGSSWDDSFHAAHGEGILTGNGGADIYDFVQGDTLDMARSIYLITDFDDDDRIWISRDDEHHQIRRAQRTLEERIEDGLEDYTERFGANEPRLTFHHDWSEDYRRTVIEVDFDRDDTIDLEILISGEHVLLIEHA